jgi:hypothetical protein
VEDVRLQLNHRNSIRTDPTQWRHCPGLENPADHLSRGLLGNLIQSLETWWRGSSWLGTYEAFWPSRTFTPVKTLPEKKRDPSHVLTATISASLIYASKFSSYWRLMRTTAWVFRFLQNVRGKEKSAGANGDGSRRRTNVLVTCGAEGNFHVRAGSSSKELCLPSNSKIAGYNLFLEDGLIRLSGILQCSDLSRERHPLLLAGSHHFTELLILDTYPVTSLRGPRRIVGASYGVLEHQRPTNYQEGPAQVSTLQNIKQCTRSAN